MCQDHTSANARVSDGKNAMTATFFALSYKQQINK